MDPFTQRMLEKAEQRSRALGISNAASKFPLSECASGGGGDANVGAGAAITKTMAATQQIQKLQAQTQMQMQQTLVQRTPVQVVEKMSTVMESVNVSSTSGSSTTPSKVLRQFSALDKENMDLGIEINIVTDKHVEVQVQVEEQDITDDNSEVKTSQAQRLDVEPINQPLAKIRDTSRNRLQRLGALYSNTDDLSSPIHRTEAQFHAGSADDVALNADPKKAKQRYGKLAALANSINQWEDDTSHHYAHHHAPVDAVNLIPPPKPDLPSRKLSENVKMKGKAPAPPLPPTTNAIATNANVIATDHGVQSSTAHADDPQNSNKTKQLNWDPKVIDSLEAQGFQRRESSNVKYAYDYSKEPETTAIAETPRGVAKLASNFAVPEEKKQVEKKSPAVKSGLVSGRAAAFESKANSNANQLPQKPQKDPTELSLKERMQLFERNKGGALIPKAALGMAPSINQIRQDGKAPLSASSTHTTNSGSSAVSGKTNGGQESSRVRDKVAALVANATTISENNIKAEISKQRQEDMQLLANRFNKQKEVFTTKEQQQILQEAVAEAKKTQQHDSRPQTKKAQQQAQIAATTAALTAVSSVVRPPPPPPPPQMHMAAATANSSKRRSPGDAIEDEESKRAKTSSALSPPAKPAKSNANRLYPALSDFDTKSESEYSEDDNNCATTATASGRSTADEQSQPQLLTRDRGNANAAGLEPDNDNDNDSYMESEGDDSSAGICNGSLGREVMQAVQKNEHHHQQQQQHQQKQQKKKCIKEVRYAEKNYYFSGAGDSSINTSDDASMGMDDYLDEALDNNVDDGDDDCTQESDEEEDAENTSRASRGSKGTTASNSFSFRKTPKKYANYQTISEEKDDYHTPAENAAGFKAPPVKSQLSVNQEDENMVTLVHTVSFYRRQQNANSGSSTPVRKITREQQVPRSALEGAASAAHALHFDSPEQHGVDRETAGYSEDDDTHSESEMEDDQQQVQEKIKRLLDEVCKQQQVIAQASQALNLCAATVEFSGSTESVEGERHLLVATHRRQACLHEVQRLRVENSLRPLGALKDKGRLTVKEITVPLRQDYIRKLAADTISGHHLVCLLKYNEHVLATKTVPTLPGLLAVKFPDVLQLNNVYADFKITLEIYGMTAQREVLPHEVKYHINLSKKTGVKTPKKKGGENILVMPPVQSPAGPNVVRTPALVQYGFAIFSLREIQRTTWTLTQVLGVSPLDGIVHMKVNCELSVSVEYKGFLTMFEDISGFGAWHRRWCHLSGAMLNYWKYPDDEKKKTPMGSIDLYTCCSPKVSIAPRDICARLNTMLLECQRPAKDNDKESLIIVPNGRTTIVRHLLSADTKDEREEWCAYFNKALTLLRAWGPPQ